MRAMRMTRTFPRPWNDSHNLPFVNALHLARPGDFDLIWAERPHVARFCVAHRKRTIVDLDDLEHVRMARFLKVGRGWRERARLAYPYLLYHHYELVSSRRFLASIVCSEEDRAYLQRRGVGNVVVVANGPNLLSAWSGPSAARKRDPNSPLRVAFLGNVAAEPNGDAIAFFVEEILPVLRAEMPATSFDVIGPNASDAIVERYASSVRFRGFVDDLGSALADYDVLAAPLRFGSGTKLKILDAMAHHLPVVTTPIGAAGLSLRNGEHALLAETASALADGILRIKRDPGLGHLLAANAYSHVRDHFSWDGIRDRLVDWLSRLRPA
jgi:glycosyltransferase involved in cell wall biosynthesis